MQPVEEPQYTVTTKSPSIINTASRMSEVFRDWLCFLSQPFFGPSRKMSSPRRQCHAGPIAVYSAGRKAPTQVGIKEKALVENVNGYELPHSRSVYSSSLPRACLRLPRRGFILGTLKRVSLQGYPDDTYGVGPHVKSTGIESGAGSRRCQQLNSMDQRQRTLQAWE